MRPRGRRPAVPVGSRVFTATETSGRTLENRQRPLSHRVSVRTVAPTAAKAQTNKPELLIKHLSPSFSTRDPKRATALALLQQLDLWGWTRRGRLQASYSSRRTRTIPQLSTRQRTAQILPRGNTNSEPRCTSRSNAGAQNTARNLPAGGKRGDTSTGTATGTPLNLDV